MTLEEKLQVAEVLDEMGVDIIEAGFPIASNGDFEAVVAVAKQVKNAVVAGLARAIPADIARAGEAVRHARQGRIHTFVSTSPIHLAHQMKKTEERGARDHHRHGDPGAQPHRQCRVERDGRDAHADRLPLPLRASSRSGPARRRSTFPTPSATPCRRSTITLFKTLIERVPGGDKVIWSTHCHNDLGLAVANSLAGVRAGARQVECTINGLGERAGNAALEEIVMALRTRADAMPYHTGIETTDIAQGEQGRLGGGEFPGAVQQGDRRQERLRARERHPPGRHAEERRRPTRS